MFGRMSTLADYQRIRTELAGRFDGQIILPEMDPVGTGCDCDINSVVDDSKGTGVFTDSDKFSGNGQKLIIIDIFRS